MFPSSIQVANIPVPDPSVDPQQLANIIAGVLRGFQQATGSSATLIASPAATASGEAAPPRPAPGGKFGEVVRPMLEQLERGDVPENGWSKIPELPSLLKKELTAEQYRAIKRAAENGGFLTRDEAFEILRRDKNQRLNGFTKGPAALTKRLRDKGELSQKDGELLKAKYLGSSEAVGFVMPVQVAAIMRAHLKANLD